ncbi:filamentous hemagglutinin N-terminal domain-containing protein [Iningainema tapete]|uniref:S-layer family protein n=1 Tax=Iningainema tapete BLCC-T55 TaxID=2748662 RepID=A0A8J7C762_9CYAN|nr:filamentous hemagglutinin N-terminal domain-containing protein [Iningainema tapete]MBD2772786.1 S-layer family protein [Iningainema tapete BLCC-T55]
MSILRRTRWIWVLGILISSFSVYANFAHAQIREDGTLPNNSSVTLEGNIFNITGGTTAGSNLFHSFSEFSVPNNSIAWFQNATNIQNIISRVTGGSISNIDGTILTNGTANLFLINPRGIVFGQNASLNVDGSFIASTASSLQFADGSQFSTNTAQSTPLLTISAPIGLQFGENPGSIQNQSQTKVRIDNRDFTIGLLGTPGKTLALVGGDITLTGGNLTAPGGRIELGSVGSNSLVNLSPITQGWSLGYEGVQNFQDITLSQAQVTTSSPDGSGDIQVQGRNLTLTDGSRIITSALGSKPVGNLTVNASDSVSLTQRENFSLSGLITEALGSGNGGNLTIKTGNLIVQDGAFVRTGNEQNSTGAAGNLTVEAPFIQLTGTSPLLTLPNQITQLPSQLSTVAFGLGSAGDLTIKTNQLIVQDGGAISTAVVPPLRTSVNRPNPTTGGTLTVEAPNGSVELSGTSKDGGIPSILISGNSAGGNGGDLTINTGRLSVTDGAVILTSAFPQGQAGNLTVNASESVTLSGVASLPLNVDILEALIRVPRNFLPEIFTVIQDRSVSSLVSGTRSTQPSANIKITTPSLIVKDQAQVFANNIGQGDAGNIDVTAGLIQLDNQALFRAETRFGGQGGNITLSNLNLLALLNGSRISTTAGLEGAGGNGGNITINAPNGSVVAVPNQNSDITANAFSGAGGRIEINSLGVFGIEERSQEDLRGLLRTTDLNLLPERSPTNDITAFSATNPVLNGQVTINTPDVDPSRGLVQLPEVVVNTPELVASGCAAFADVGGSSFTVTGRGGLPLSPDQPLSNDVVWTDTRLPIGNGENQRVSNTTTHQKPQKNDSPAQRFRQHTATGDRITMTPATGWVFNGKGEVTLISSASNATIGTTPTSCAKQ